MISQKNPKQNPLAQEVLLQPVSFNAHVTFKKYDDIIHESPSNQLNQSPSRNLLENDFFDWTPIDAKK